MSRPIDADKLIAEICEGCDAVAKGLCDNDVCASVCWLAEAPTLTYADLVPHGRWEPQEEHDFISGEEIVTGFCCSLCGLYYTEKHNYCPNCGAKMDGGKEK